MRRGSGKGTPLRDALASKRVIVCCGSGGVGKTTTSAALALRAAADGRSAIVITIDPARRLATSLGLKELSAAAADLSDHVNRALKEEGHAPLKGRFHAVMPDTTQTFERFIRSMAGENEGLARKVLKTSIYKVFAQEFSGTNEYMAMEKLYELYNERKYDLIVLDTPPSPNTKAFLEAPARLADFFDDRVMKWFIAPGSRLFAGAFTKAMGLLERVTGHGFISSMLEFAQALFDMRSQFKENLANVGHLLHQGDVSFLMVTSPERLSKGDTQEFIDIITEQGYPFWGFVVNRVLAKRLGLDVGAVQAPDAASVSKDELRILRACFETLVPALEQERDAERFLIGVGKNTGLALIPEQPADVHSIDALVRVSDRLVE